MGLSGLGGVVQRVVQLVERGGGVPAVEGSERSTIRLDCIKLFHGHLAELDAVPGPEFDLEGVEDAEGCLVYQHEERFAPLPDLADDVGGRTHLAGADLDHPQTHRDHR
ncbi:MAG: hypothetical protein EXR71_03515 [Myxococcales bacterium]|nr:hypothetical protein [Myxococcales bacterium]